MSYKSSGARVSPSVRKATHFLAEKGVVAKAEDGIFCPLIVAAGVQKSLSGDLELMWTHVNATSDDRQIFVGGIAGASAQLNVFHAGADARP